MGDCVDQQSTVGYTGLITGLCFRLGAGMSIKFGLVSVKHSFYTTVLYTAEVLSWLKVYLICYYALCIITILPMQNYI